MAEKIENRLELLDSELRRFVKVAEEQFDAERVILFGSLAQGRIGSINEWTDLDLAVVAETDLPFHERIRSLLESVRPMVGADVLVYTPAEWERLSVERPFIREEIVEKGRVIYERSG